MAKKPHRINESQAMSNDYSAGRYTMDHMTNSDAPTNPGYSYTKSLPGRSMSDLKRGYKPEGSLGDTGSDPADPA